jgi:hypothetical protein
LFLKHSPELKIDQGIRVYGLINTRLRTERDLNGLETADSHSFKLKRFTKVILPDPCLLSKRLAASSVVAWMDTTVTQAVVTNKLILKHRAELEAASSSSPPVTAAAWNKGRDSPGWSAKRPSWSPARTGGSYSFSSHRLGLRFWSRLAFCPGITIIILNIYNIR